MSRSEFTQLSTEPSERYKSGHEVCPIAFGSRFPNSSRLVKLERSFRLRLLTCGRDIGASCAVANGILTPLVFEGPGAVIYPQREIVGDAPRKEIARTRSASLEEHWRDFLNCVRTRQQPRSKAELGYYVMTALHMGIRSFLEGRTMEFDETTQTVRPAKPVKV